MGYVILPLCVRAPSEEELIHSGFITGFNFFPYTLRPSDWSLLFLFLVYVRLKIFEKPTWLQGVSLEKEFLFYFAPQSLGLFFGNVN